MRAWEKPRSGLLSTAKSGTIDCPTTHASAARQNPEVCAVYHGLDGLAKIPEAPNLAGQKEGYLIEQMSAFKSGERKNEMISILVQDLSPTDIENLAVYYSRIEISVGKTPARQSP